MWIFLTVLKHWFVKNIRKLPVLISAKSVDFGSQKLMVFGLIFAALSLRCALGRENVLFVGFSLILANLVRENGLFFGFISANPGGFGSQK